MSIELTVLTLKEQGRYSCLAHAPLHFLLESPDLSYFVSTFYDQAVIDEQQKGSASATFE